MRDRGGVGLGGGGRHDRLVWKDSFAERKGVVSGGEVGLNVRRCFRCRLYNM